MRTLLVMFAVLPMLGVPGFGAANVTGDWSVAITTADGRMTGRATLTQSADKVTGHIGPSEDATIAIEGVLKGQKLTLQTHPRPGRTAAFDTCALTIKEGKMVGTIKGGDAGSGTIEFVRTRANQ